jgi:AraC-like DNA-binding protein
MEIVCLLGEPTARSALRRALPKFRWGREICRVSFFGSWEELDEKVRSTFLGVAVVDPLFGNPNGGPARQLDRIRYFVEGGGIVFFSHLERKRGFTHPIAHLGSVEFPILILPREDCSPEEILCALATAYSRRDHRKLLDLWSARLTNAGFSLFRALVLHWPRVSSVEDLAQKMNTSGRHLRRISRFHGLPSPSRVLRATRVLDSRGFVELGVSSPSRLAVLLGYSDSFSLSRVWRDFLGLPLSELGKPGSWDRVMSAVDRALLEALN